MASPARSRVALICCTVLDGTLQILMRDAAERTHAELPSGAVAAGADLEDAARAVASTSVGRAPNWMTQSGTVMADALVVGFVTVVPPLSEVPTGHHWASSNAASAASALTAALIRPAIATLRDRLDRDPVAFRLLPATFTLSDLQRVYEVLLERRLHKASFRRTLLAAHLVEPTESWRSEGRGRPAQLFRYSPRRRRGVQRPVRFELLS